MNGPTPNGNCRQPPEPGSWWGTVGIVLACVVGAAGLALLAFVIGVFIYIGSIGANK
jgi:hypothetical protein